MRELQGRPQNLPSGPVAAVSAVIVEDGGVLLVKRRAQPNKGLWSLPGGAIELAETARDALKREVLEETGLVVEVGDVAGVHDVISRQTGGIDHHCVIVSFHAGVVSGELGAGSDAEDARWVTLDEIGSLPVTPGLIERLRAMGLPLLYKPPECR